MKSVQTEFHGAITEQNNLRVWICAFTIIPTVNHRNCLCTHQCFVLPQIKHK